MASFEAFTVSVLDYGAGNVRSLRNAIRLLGYNMKDVITADDISNAQAIIFPGQGNFRQAMKSIRDRGWIDALKMYVKADRPFFGICLGMQLLFEGSEESPGVEGLCLIPGMITKFDNHVASVPQIGWNGVTIVKDCATVARTAPDDMVYFVHSFCAMPTADNLEWILGNTDYADQKYISMVSKGNVMAAQFHPEKSGTVGLNMIGGFLDKYSGRGASPTAAGVSNTVPSRGSSGVSSFEDLSSLPSTVMGHRVIACLDVRSNDSGDLVVTKGDQYDVREKDTSTSNGRGGVRNLGKPVALCKRYYDDGADEVVFLNITSFRQGVLGDLPMLQVLESASEKVFVPLTVGGGIREYKDPEGREWSSLEVASRYFRAGADKVSIGSDAVYAAEAFLATGVLSGRSSIEQISNHYGAQAVVVSIDPKREYVENPMSSSDSNTASNSGEEGGGVEGEVEIIAEQEGEHPQLALLRGMGKTVVHLSESQRSLTGQEYCWWPCTVQGGRATRPLDAVRLAKICEILGAGEIMLNCINMDGQGSGYDTALISAVQNAVSIPVIASSGAGAPEHFSQVFQRTPVKAALAAGIFHRNEVSIAEVKQHLLDSSIPVRAIKTSSSCSSSTNA
mmetsp:Transcript_11613/g.19461  ORF Transcript_11613/g.19461 Transcript_11613/m.19461 type:complete len:621 (+) Transcript_11613:50-1912(+)